MRNSLFTYIMICLLPGIALAQQDAADTTRSEQISPRVVSSSAAPASDKAPAQAQAVTPVASPVPAAVPAAVPAQVAVNNDSEAVRYTLGPDDVINITVQRHPEFTGDFPVNQEGKIQFRYVGDVDVNGLTKKEVEDKVRKLISRYVANPEVTVTIVEFRSKYYFVIGEVAHPGKIYMRSETTTVRDAVVAAGLPTIAAAMRKCVLITPDKIKPKKRSVNIYAILYGGNLKKNLEMRSGDTLYVPSTVMAKVFRTVAPITAPVTEAAEAQTGLNTLNTRPSATVPAGQTRY
ncbi:MAG TPA: polysaccharide biosynthesis/export family protein [Candidatus Omnitrophota bacterium]|nr:polysaccharide biosynthesis/export family protein [Candidatus Omnitrophota bacterium]